MIITGELKDSRNKLLSLKLISSWLTEVDVKSTTKQSVPIAPAIPDTIQIFDPCGWDLDPNHPNNIDPATKKRKANFKPKEFGCFQTTKAMGMTPYQFYRFRPYKIGKIKGQQKPDDKMLFEILYPTIWCR
jgi:hypothetical protein